MVIFLEEEYGIGVSNSTVSITSQIKRSEDLRAYYRARIAEIVADEAIFVDESAARLVATRRALYYPTGVRRDGVSTPARGVNGYLDYEIYHGSCNKDRFNAFIRRVLMKMKPYTGPRSVLIMDNFQIHYSLVSSPLAPLSIVLI